MTARPGFLPLHATPQADVPDVLTLPLVELQRRLRQRELTAVELVETHIRRVGAVNTQLNALISDRFPAARKEAAEADVLLRSDTDREKLPPLLGIPCTVKEFFALTGYRQTGGMLAYREQVATQDATLVERLRTAGAIVLGQTNVPEGGMWMETWNRLYGRTQNPWNLRHTCGGSSGGEGAMVSAGASVFGLGSDIGGSVRIPAAFCGTVGHKPTGGLLPLTGHFPGAIPGTQFLCAGPLCRAVGDVWPLLQVMAGPDGKDADCQRSLQGHPSKIAIDRVRVFAVAKPAPTRAVMREAVGAATEALASRGAQVQELDSRIVELLQAGMFLWSAAVTGRAQTSYEEILSGGKGISIAQELLAFPLRKNRYIVPSLATVALERLTQRMQGSARMQTHREQLAVLQASLDALLGDDGVLITPPYTRPAPLHYETALTPLHIRCTAIYNALGYPATVVPVGLSASGLPVCVQVVGRMGSDALTVAVAGALEAHFGTFRASQPQHS